MGLLVTSKIKVSCLNVKLKTNWRIVKDMKLCFMQYHIFFNMEHTLSTVWYDSN
jgi:hypothetical protein